MQAALRAQVVPAVEEHADGNAERAGGGDEVGLGRAEVHQRRDQQDVGRLFLEKRLVERIDGQLSLGQGEHGIETRNLRRGQIAQSRGHRVVVGLDAQLLAQLLHAAGLQLGRVPHRRLLVVHAVAQAAQEPGGVGPAVGAMGRTADQREPRRVDRLAVLIRATVGVLLDGERHRVPAIDQRADGVGEGLDVLLLFEDEQDLHASGALVRRSLAEGGSCGEPALAPRGDRAAGATS